MNNILSYFEGLDPQTRTVAIVLVAISILLILAIFYTLTRKRSSNGAINRSIQHERKISELEEKNLTLRKRLSRYPTTELERPEESDTSLDQARKVIRLQKGQIDALKTDLSNWKQRSIRAEEIIEQKVNELSAVYKADRDYNQGVTTLFLSHISNIKDINTAFTSHRIPAFTMPKVGTGVIAVALIGYFYLNKKLTNQIMTLLATPRFQLYLALGMVAVGTGIYYWKYRKDKK